MVERHGPMVLRLRREIGGNDHDAFQATFLILVRKGRTLWVKVSKKLGRPRSRRPPRHWPRRRNQSKLAAIKSPSRPRSVYQAPEPLLAIFSQTKAWVHNPETQPWHTYTASKGIQFREVGPSPSRDFVVLGLSGDAITEVVAFSVKAGKWIRQALIEPAGKSLRPHMGNHLVAYFVGRHAYAFSSLTGKWSTQVLSEPVHQGMFPCCCTAMAS